jgi:hypothetical protein
MSDFFHGWRRKAGCVTLVMACVVTSAWIRSLYLRERFERGSLNKLTIISANGSFRVQWRQWEIGILRGGWWEHAFGNRDVPRGINAIDNDWNPMEGQDIQWRAEFAGFHCGKGLAWGGHGSTATCYSCIVPYLPTAVPLTILSAYLLLWPAKRPNRKGWMARVRSASRSVQTRPGSRVME